MKVTIITVCKNAQGTIEATIKSVLSQNYKNIEYIVIDGKSTDKTLNILHKYKNQISAIVSESDHGLYFAMNKGIAKSTGDILYFLNSGDQLFDNNTISNIVKVFKKTNSDIVYGDIELYESGNQVKRILRRQDHVSNFYLVHDTIYHQSIFAKKHIFKKYGKFDTRYKLQADYEWILRLIIRNNVPFYYSSQTVAIFLRGGLSFNEIESFKERFTILPRYFNLFQVIFNGFFFWLLYRVYVKIRRDCFSKG